MAELSLGQAARVTGLDKITITRAIKSRWHSARRKEDGSYDIDPAEQEPSAIVPLKTAEQQSALMVHRARDLLIRQRTMLVNALRGHLAEFGLVEAQGLHKWRD
jgi:transposase